MANLSGWGVDIKEAKNPKEMTPEEREIELLERTRDILKIMKKIESHLEAISNKKGSRYDS
ncbi:MAG: hypothetical protein KBA26_04540 [Candidatus Delongbacteria bacterium]|nr:hypothetical protein [Candidatus Delongbacteria bacterium]